MEVDYLKYWDYERNNILKINIDDITKGSNVKVCWTCDNNHHIIQTPHNKSKGQGCPYCSNQKILPGYNDLQSKCPEIALLWDYEKNYPLTPDMVFPSSSDTYWWKCDKCNNSFDSSPGHIKRGRGCPFCSGKRVKKGYNDLATTHPQLADEWDYERNLLNPTQVSHGSNEKVWWKDSYGHQWYSQINSRSKGQGCPYCTGQKILPGFNDLSTKAPNLVNEWNYDKNENLQPYMFTANSTETVWWKCSFCSNEWISSIDNRMRDRGCPKCNNRSRTSFPEQAIYYYIKNIYLDAINSYKSIFDNDGSELDIYIPSKRIGIEYDGHYHSNENKSYQRDANKYEICKKNDITLIRVRNNCSTNTENLADYVIPCSFDTQNYSDLDDAINKLFDIINANVKVNCYEDKNKIKAQYLEKIKNNSISSKAPNVASEWDYDKNYPLTPDMFTYGSGDSMYWKCKYCESSWEAKIYARTRYDTLGCPNCQMTRFKRSNVKKVRNIDTQEIFDSLNEAAEAYNISYTEISKVCRKIKESVKGTHWEFIT